VKTSNSNNSLYLKIGEITCLKEEENVTDKKQNKELPCKNWRE
jgi:hypothetical protein